MISVLVTYRASADQADALEAALRRYIPHVRQEPGCVRFEVTRSKNHPTVFHLLEVYASVGALEAHKASDHYARFVEEEFLPRLEERIVELGTPLGT